jgi:hypothetical protein
MTLIIPMKDHVTGKETAVKVEKRRYPKGEVTFILHQIEHSFADRLGEKDFEYASDRIHDPQYLCNYTEVSPEAADQLWRAIKRELKRDV